MMSAKENPGHADTDGPGTDGCHVEFTCDHVTAQKQGHHGRPCGVPRRKGKLVNRWRHEYVHDVVAGSASPKCHLQQSDNNQVKDQSWKGRLHS